MSTLWLGSTRRSFLPFPNFDTLILLFAMTSSATFSFLDFDTSVLPIAMTNSAARFLSLGFEG
jgi:prepilin signal peptidase PulO-like enzyme (type II secretory pathway)